MVIATKSTEATILLERIIELQSTVYDTIRNPYCLDNSKVNIKGKELLLKTPPLPSQLFKKNQEPWKVQVYNLFLEDVLHTIIHSSEGDTPRIEHFAQYSPREFIEHISTNYNDIRQVKENVLWLLDKFYNRNLII